MFRQFCGLQVKLFPTPKSYSKKMKKVDEDMLRICFHFRLDKQIKFGMFRNFSWGIKYLFDRSKTHLKMEKIIIGNNNNWIIGNKFRTKYGFNERERAVRCSIQKLLNKVDSGEAVEGSAALKTKFFCKATTNRVYLIRRGILGQLL